MPLRFVRYECCLCRKSYCEPEEASACESRHFADEAGVRVRQRIEKAFQGLAPRSFSARLAPTPSKEP